MSIKKVDATHFRVDGSDYLFADYFAQVIEGNSLQVTKVSDGTVLVGRTPYAQIKDAGTGEYLKTPAEFATFVSTVFGIAVSDTPPVAATATVAGLVKKAGVVANTAPAQSAAYVQADAQAVLTELRALKTSLQAAGVLS